MFAKELFLIFILSFLLNWIWENLHSHFYVHYKNGPITQLILLRAAFVDAVFITVLGVFFLKFSYLGERLWIGSIVGIVSAIFLELYAIKNNRWAYKKSMPIIPLLNIGLTPTIQIGFIAYIVFKLAI